MSTLALLVLGACMGSLITIAALAPLAALRDRSNQ